MPGHSLLTRDIPHTLTAHEPLSQDSWLSWLHLTNHHNRLVFSVTVFTVLLGNVFQQWTFLCPRAHVLAGRRLPTPRWLTSISQLDVAAQRLSTMGSATLPRLGQDRLSQPRAVSDCLTPNSKSTHLTPPSRDSELSLDWLACPVGPCDITSGRTQQKTPCLAAAMLQYDVPVATDPQKTPLPGVASLLCDVTAVAGTCLSRHCLAKCLGFQQMSHY
jgi:hypothetical protein